MFSKISRYKKLNDVVTTDAKGRSLESKIMRLLPEVSGTFLHTLEEVDRLDHLAFKYYKQPGKWWRICDANPRFMSPLAMMGKEPITTTRFIITFNETGIQPVWSELLKTLSQKLGVKNVSLELDTQLVKKTTEYEGQPVKVHAETFKWVVTVTYNNLNVTAANLKKFIEDQGFKADEWENIGRVGKKIVIPPNAVG